MTIGRALTLLFLLAAGTTRCAPATDAPLHLLAASSLAEVAHAVADGWSSRHGRAVVVRLAASSTLARQIRDGAPAHLFLSADPLWVDGLDALVRRPWLGNRLALVAPRDAPDPDLAALPSLALGAESVPVGRYARAALEMLAHPLPGRVVQGAHARDVLAKVSAGAAPAGIVYVTDAALDDDVRVVSVLPADSHPPIRYEAALLDDDARLLFDALDAPWVVSIARTHGFEAVR